MSNPKRVLHIVQRMEAGGTQALLMNLYRNINRTKLQFDFLVEYPSKQFYDDEIISLGGKIYYSNVRNDYNIIKFEKQLEGILKTNKYKIIHVHAYTIGYFCLKVAKKCGVPVRIAHSHNNEAVRDKKYLFKKIMQKLYPIYATDLFACSTSAGKYLFKNRDFMVLNNAIDTKKFIFDVNQRNKVRKELKLENCFVVGNIGRLHPQKNHKFLIEIFNEIKKIKKNSKLIIIGSGPLEDEIKDKIKLMKLEQDVLLLGNRNDVNYLLMAMDVFILPSLFEGLGIVAVEAQASGTPVVASNMVPKETDISPIIRKLSLKECPYTWAAVAVKLSTNKASHKDLSKYIIEKDYDLSSTVSKMEQFYIEKIKNS